MLLRVLFFLWLRLFSVKTKLARVATFVNKFYKKKTKKINKRFLKASVPLTRFVPQIEKQHLTTEEENELPFK